MPKLMSLPVKNLQLDLHNYRTVPQPDEQHALDAMLSIKPDRFWGLAESLLENGYFQSEGVLVIDNSVDKIVKEGNRRIAALKVIFGILTPTVSPIPAHIQKLISALTPAWKKANAAVPCTVYSLDEEDLVDKQVALTHGKAQKASRDQWTSVARARHNRDEGFTESGLDLLEKYLATAGNASPDQKQRWAGDYPLTVLDEMLKRIPDAFGFPDGKKIAAAYPSIKNLSTLDDIIQKIGLKILGFDEFRKDLADTVIKFSLPMPKALSGSVPSPSSSSTGTVGSATPGAPSSAPSTAAPTSTGAPATTSTSTGPKSGPKVMALEDPRSVTAYVKLLTIVGSKREKAETIRNEMEKLNITKTPLAFSFLLRSFLEIMAKTYVDSRPTLGISLVDKGQDRPLLDVLRDISKHVAPSADGMPKGPARDAARLKHRQWHGVMETLANPTSVLSITSMNVLIHNPLFSARAEVFSTQFHNLRPLIEELNTVPATP